MIQKSMSATPDGALVFGGADVRELAEQYGTPLYIMDENRLRENMRAYVRGMARAFGPGALPAYAGKALCFKQLYRILAEEGMGADVVSGGELYTALQAGFSMEKVYFHGNHKEEWEIALALDSGVFCFMADNEYELENLSRMAGARGIRAKVMLRLTPGVDPHTYAAVNTGKMDCQFGRPVETGQAAEFVKKALDTPHLDVLGYHCHLGSQIFTTDPYRIAIEKMLDLMKQIKDETGFEAPCLDLGGGFGVRYVESDPALDISAALDELGAFLDAACAARDLKKPEIHMEPGRSIVADAGMTLYRAGAIKQVRGHRDYVIVDGGMTDNPRYALYKSAYTVYNASRVNEKADWRCSVAGRCCESGALIQENVMLPASTRSGDLIAVAVTGAYNYSMASNYNRLRRLPIVLVKDGKSSLAVRRETLEDLVKCDL